MYYLWTLCTADTNIGRARRTPQTRSSTPDAKEGPGAWQIIFESKHDSSVRSIPTFLQHRECIAHSLSLEDKNFAVTKIPIGEELLTHQKRREVPTATNTVTP